MSKKRFKTGVTYVVIEDFIRYGSELGYYLIPKGWKFVVEANGNIRFPKYNYNLDSRVRTAFIKSVKCMTLAQYLEKLDELESNTSTSDCVIS